MRQKRWHKRAGLAATLLAFSCGGGDSRERDAASAIDGAPGCGNCGLCIDSPGSPTPFERTLIELPAASWYDAPGTDMRTVCVADSVGVRGVSGCGAIVNAWNGGAYDSTRQRMLIWGGGHDDYWGNELYAFDLQQGTWSRVTEPSSIPAGTAPDDFLSRDPLPDGQPASRHTYDGIEYLADLDLLFAHGGSRARDGNATPRTWFFDPVVTTWRMGSDGPGGYSDATAYDRARQQLFVKTAESLHIYNVAGDSWSEVSGFGTPPLWPRYATGGDKTAAFDVKRGLMWSVGSGEILVWDAAAMTAVTDSWVTTGGGTYTNTDTVGNRTEQLFESGGGDIYNVPAPGFDYDSASDAFVAWPNSGAPRALDLATRTWSLGSDAGAPTSMNSGGTFGRWRYAAAYNVFILVNSVDENVHFYKHTAGCGK